MAWNASPMELVPVAHALITESETPFALKRIATLPVAMLPIIIGMKNGETLRGPPFSRFTVLLMKVFRPPMPAPM